MNLAWKLSYVLNGISKDSILDSYPVERLPVIAEMLNITTDLYKRGFSGEIARRVLANGSATANADEGQKKSQAWFSGKKLLQLDINYRWSDIVFDERFISSSIESVEKHAYGEDGQAVRAGDRAPDAPGLECLYAREGKAIGRLFDAFNVKQHTALVFATDVSDTRDIRKALSGFPEGMLQTVLILPATSSLQFPAMTEFDFVLKDVEVHAHSGYGVDLSNSPLGAAAVIVRPDAWIGAFATSASGVQEYISRVFAS